MMLTTRHAKLVRWLHLQWIVLVDALKDVMEHPTVLQSPCPSVKQCRQIKWKSAVT